MTMADKGLRVQVDTNELTPEDAGKVMMMKDKFGYFVFAEQVNENDIKDLPKIILEKEEKSPSARLRATLFVYWKQKKVGNDFDLFYKRWINKKINEIKDLLT